MSPGEFVNLLKLFFLSAYANEKKKKLKPRAKTNCRAADFKANSKQISIHSAKSQTKSSKHYLPSTPDIFICTAREAVAS